MRVAIASDLADIVRLGVLTFDELRVEEGDARLDEPLAEVARRMARADPDIGAVRSMYRRLGIDPTKTRPSSEALLRRVRKGDAWPRINSLVDVCNWCSLEFQLPYGLYDLDRVRGDVVLRRGGEAEEYAGIRKQVVHVSGRPTLADANGPFGNPTSDSARTMVTSSTRRALVVTYAPRALTDHSMSMCLDATSLRVIDFAGGAEVSRVYV